MIERFTWERGEQPPEILRTLPQNAEGQYVHSFLSNFFPCRIKHEGAIYASVEHAFQASKLLDPRCRHRFTQDISAGGAKNEGRRLTDLRADWEEIKRPLMLALLRQKFAIHESLRVSLMFTTTEALVEGNVWGDDFWGAVRHPNDFAVPATQTVWEQGEADCLVGWNYLGKALMEVRDEIRLLAGNAVRDLEHPYALGDRIAARQT